MKSSGKSLPSMKRQEESLQFFFANVKSVELEDLLAGALKRKRKGLLVRSSLKTAPIDLSRLYVNTNRFEPMMNHLAHVPPFSSILPGARVIAPLLTKYCVPAVNSSDQNACPVLNQRISFALVYIYHSYFGFPLEIVQHVARLFYKVDLAPAALRGPDNESQHYTDERPEFVQFAGQWLTETTNNSRLEEFESKYIESLATAVPLLWSVLLRPIDEFSSSSAENRALELVRSGAYDEAADSFRALSNAEQSILRHRFNIAYCLSLTGDIEEALATTRESLRAQFQDAACMLNLKKHKEQFEFGATCYLTANLNWRQGKYAVAADWLDLLERFVGINLVFSRDLRLLARLASGAAVLSSDLESLHPILGRPSLHLTISTASSLRSTGRPDLLQPLLESRASRPVRKLLELWKQAVAPAASVDELVRRLLTDGARGDNAAQASSHEAVEAASPQLEPAVQAHEHADDSNDPDLSRSGSAVESPPSQVEEPLEANVAQPVRIALDHLLTVNRRRADRFATLQSLLERLDSEAFKQWHVVMEELGYIESELEEAFDACKAAGLADLQQYEQVTECLVELGRRSLEDLLRLKQHASKIMSTTEMSVVLVTLEHFGTQSEACRSAVRERDEALAVSIEPDVPLLYFVVADAQTAEHSQELVPLLNDIFNSEYVYRRYRESFGFCLALATAACWYAAQLDAPHWSACAKAFLSPIREVFPHTCQLLGSILERPAKLAVVAKAPQTSAVTNLNEPYATELARAAHQMTIECAHTWLRHKLARIYKTQIN